MCIPIHLADEFVKKKYSMEYGSIHLYNVVTHRDSNFVKKTLSRQFDNDKKLFFPNSSRKSSNNFLPPEKILLPFSTNYAKKNLPLSLS